MVTLDGKTHFACKCEKITNEFLGDELDKKNSPVKFPTKYAYARSNPLSAKDPTGLKCVTTVTQVDNDAPLRTTTCTFDGITFEPFETPPGWKDPTSRDQSLYHDYDYLWGKALCKKDLQDELERNPTPGDDAPASDEGTPNDANPWGPVGLLSSPVTSYVGIASDGSRYVMNVSKPGHALHPGYVVRMAVDAPDGISATVRNIGEGLSLAQSKFNPLSGAINSIWYDESDKNAATANAHTLLRGLTCD